MPGRNLEKIYLEHSFYHVYNRGLNKQPVFLDDEDYAVFLNLYKRYLSPGPVLDGKKRPYFCLHGKIELLAFCLMRNHFHALVYQTEADAMTQLFKLVSTTYGMYFNKKYVRVGPVFQSRFRASLIQDDSYLEHISRYIHLNPHEYKTWRFSSYPYYLGKQSAEWLQPRKILEIFNNNTEEYAQFVSDYKDHKERLAAVQAELALP